MDFRRAKPADQRQAARLIAAVQLVDQADQIIGLQRGAAFQANRVLDAAEIFDMGMVKLARAVANPEHVAGCGIGVARRRRSRIAPRQRLLVAKQQSLVRSVEIGGAHLRNGFGIQADGAHETQRFVDAGGQFLIAARLGAVLDEIQHPAMRVFQIGKAAGGKSPDEVERRRRLVVGLQLPRRIRHAGRGGKIIAIDNIAAIAGQLDAAHGFAIRRARLGELPGDTADLDDRRPRAKRQHHGHLQENLEEIADIIGRMLAKGFGAIATLQQEGLARRNLGQSLLQLARLARKHQRRKTRNLALDIAQGLQVGIDRGLQNGLFAPGIWAPADWGHGFNSLSATVALRL